MTKNIGRTDMSPRVVLVRDPKRTCPPSRAPFVMLTLTKHPFPRLRLGMTVDCHPESVQCHPEACRRVPRFARDDRRLGRNYFCRLEFSVALSAVKGPSVTLGMTKPARDDKATVMKSIAEIRKGRMRSKLTGFCRRALKIANRRRYAASIKWSFKETFLFVAG